MTDHDEEYYTSATGDLIRHEDYARWIEQATEAYHVLDDNFNDGAGAEHPDDKQDQLSDLLCELQHFAQAEGLDFAAAVASAATNYDAERKARTGCPTCTAPLTDRTETYGHPSYCDVCDREVEP